MISVHKKTDVVYPKSENGLWNAVEDEEAKRIVYPEWEPRIQLKRIGSQYFIEKASGPKITASKLLPGKAYLFKKLYKWREIESIEGGVVYYRDDTGYFTSCSAEHFVRACPNEATEEELYFLDEYSTI